MSSRHTPIKGSLTRSFGIDEDHRDLVVAMHEDGFVSARYEPTDRKLKRGEQLAEGRISVEELWQCHAKPIVTNAKINEVELILRRILARVPTADLGSEELGSKAHYRLQSWLWQELKKETDEQSSLH